MKKYKLVEKYSAKQKEGITLSQSSIDTMEKCPRQYYLQYILKLKVPDDQTALVFGRMFHLIIENYTGGGQEEIKGLFNLFKEDEKLREKYWDKLDDPYKDKVVKTLYNVNFYLKNRYAKISDFEHERQIDIYDYDKVDGKSIHLQGKLDGIYTIGETLFITDFKTGKKQKDHSKQLGFYLFLLSKSDTGHPNKASGEIVNLTLDSQSGYDDVLEYHNLEEYDIIRSENRVKSAISTLKTNGINLEDKDNWVKKPQKLCNWCKYYKSGNCNGKSSGD